MSPLVTKLIATHLNGSLEELYGNVVLSLQAETVSCYTPGLQTNKGQRDRRINITFFSDSLWTGGLTSGQFLSMSVRSLDRADRATSFCRCHSVVE